MLRCLCSCAWCFVCFNVFLSGVRLHACQFEIAVLFVSVFVHTCRHIRYFFRPTTFLLFSARRCFPAFVLASVLLSSLRGRLVAFRGLRGALVIAARFQSMA